jgi:hypothetical protein
MLRQPILWAFATAVLFFVATEKAVARAPQLDADIIKAGLRTADIEEDGFVEEVVDMANTGELPWAMVDNVFSWAKQKPAHRFQYFRKALITIAARKGIIVPRPPKPVVETKKSSFFVQKLKDFYAKLKGTTAKLPFIGDK